jgi:hypothetical protein
MPFCIVTTAVSGPNSLGTSLATASTWCAFRANGLDLVRLQGEDHEILHAGRAVIRGREGAFDQVFGFVAHDQLYAVPANRVQILATRDERDLFAGQRQLRPDQAPDGPRADDRNSHRYALV